MLTYQAVLNVFHSLSSPQNDLGTHGHEPHFPEKTTKRRGRDAYPRLSPTVAKKLVHACISLTRVVRMKSFHLFQHCFFLNNVYRNVQIIHSIFLSFSPPTFLLCFFLFLTSIIGHCCIYCMGRLQCC